MGLAIAAMGTAALLVFKKMVKQYVEVGDMIHKMAIRTGFAAETLSELAYAAEISGADINMLEKGVKKMSKTIVDAGVYSLETYIRVFEGLGLEVEELLQMKPEQQFLTIGAAIADMENHTLKTAAAVDIFGRAGTMLLPFFAEGAEGMANLREEAHTLGIIFDEEAAAKAAKHKDAQTALSGSVKGLSIAILNDLIPVITDVTKEFTDWFKETREGAATWAAGIIDIFKIIVQGVQGLSTAFSYFKLLTFEAGAGVAGFVKKGLKWIDKLMDETDEWRERVESSVELRKKLNRIAADSTAVEDAYRKKVAETALVIAGIDTLFRNLILTLDKVKTKTKDAKKETKALAEGMKDDLAPAAREFYGALGYVQSSLESYVFSTETVKAANEQLMESWGLTTEAQLTFTQLALSEFEMMEVSVKGFVEAILGTFEKWAIGQIIPKIMAALPFPLNLLATIGAIATIKGIFAGIRSMEEGGTVEHEGLHFLHRGEEVRSVEEVRTAGAISTTGPFHTTVNLKIYAQRLDDRTIDHAAAKIRHAIDRQGRRY